MAKADALPLEKGNSILENIIESKVSNPIVFINDAFLPEEEACLAVRDLSIQRGYGIFDFFRVAEKHPLFLDDHLNRFYYSAAQMRLPMALSKEELKGTLYTFIEKNASASYGVRITLTGGISPDGYSISKPNLIITALPIHSPSEDQRLRGIRLITYSHQRQLPHIKTIDYIMAIWLQPHIRERGADDVLYQQKGVVTECPRANFFIVSDTGKLITPEHNILKGITRNRVLQIAHQELQVEEKEVTLSDIKNAREAFITNTTKGIVPVIQVDDCIINKSVTGPVTTWLQQQLYAASAVF